MTTFEIDCDTDIKTGALLRLPQSWHRLWAGIVAYRRLRRQRRIDRQAFENLLYQDQRILDDLGYRRDAVQAAYRLPLSVNAARHLQLQRKADRAAMSDHG